MGGLLFCRNFRDSRGQIVRSAVEGYGGGGGCREDDGTALLQGEVGVLAGHGAHAHHQIGASHAGDAVGEGHEGVKTKIVVVVQGQIHALACL